MDIMKKRWLILIASGLVALCIGSVYAWSAFATPMRAYLSACAGREIPNLSIVFTLVNAVGPVTMLCGGAVNDRLGPRSVLLAGGALFGAGMIGSGFARSVTVLALTYGLGVGLGVGLIYGVAVSNTVKLFPDKSGLAGGIITACYGASAVLMPPLIHLLSESQHVTDAFKLLGAAMAVVICAAAFVIRPCPPDFRIPGTARQSGGESRDYTCREMLREPDAWLMLLTLTCGAFAGMMVISQAAQIAQGMMGMAPGLAAGAVSVIALFNTLGRLGSGALADRLGAVAALRITFAVSLLACVLLFFCPAEGRALFYIGISLIGAAFGSVMGIYPGFTAQRFGRRNNSVNYAVMFIGFSLAGLTAPQLTDAVVRASGRYQPAFLIAAAIAALGEIFAVRLSRGRRRASS